MSKTSQCDSAVKSASNGLPVISAASANVSPAFNCPSGCRVPSVTAEAATVPLNTTAEVSSFCALISDRFVSLKRSDQRAIYQLFDPLGSEVFE